VVVSKRSNAFIFFSVLKVIVGPVEAVDRKKNHNRVRNSIPEFGNIFGNFVIGLTPVDGGCLFAPKTFII